MTGIEVLGITRQIGNLYASLSLPICKQYGLNQTEFDVIMFCANNPEQNTARDLCRLRGIKTAMASVAVDRLILTGLLLRQPDAKDRRIRHLVPTEAALPIIADGRAMQRRFAQTLHRGVTSEEAAVLDTVLHKMLQNLKGEA